MPNLQIRLPNKPAASLALPAGRHRIGAAADCLVRVAGVPETAIELAVGETGLTTIQAQLPVRIAGQPFVPGVPRHLRPGEEVEIADVVVLVQCDAKAAQGTAAIARNILGSLGQGDLSNDLAGIVWLTGPDLGKRVDLTEDICFLGRGNACELRIRDRLVSRQHAKVVVEDEATRLVDLKSPNGVWVNGIRVRGELSLKGGELIQVGCTLLAYEAGTVPASVPNPPARAAAAAPTAEPKNEDSATAAPDQDPDVETEGETRNEQRVRIRSEWLLAIAGVIALGLAGAVVAIVLT